MHALVIITKEVEMEIDMLKEKIRFAVSSISGKDTITQSYGKSIMACFGFFDDNGTYIQKASDTVIEKTLSRAPMVYRGVKANPEPYFWKQIKRDAQRDENVSAGSKTYEYEKPTDEQRGAMADQARAIAEDFESKTKSFTENEKPNLYTAKVKRYRQYAKDNLVRVDDDSHVLHSQWIFKKQAEQQGLRYHCPVAWLESREIVCR